MLEEAVRLAGSLASVPVGAMMRSAQAAVSRGNAVLDLEVHRWEDTRLRQAHITRLRRAALDKSVSCVFLRLEAPPGSWAACQDFRSALHRLRTAGKPVYAWVEAPGNALVWIASACDRVFMLPTGEIALVGVGAELTFFGGLLDKLGVHPDFEAAGAYKSFGEPYTRTFASPANQEAISALVADLQEQLVDGIADGRGLTAEAVRQVLRDAPISAQQALEAKLVDQLCYEDEARAWIEHAHGGKAKFVEFDAWARRDMVGEWIDRWGDPSDAIAVFHMDGPIVVDDKGPAMMVRARRVVPMLRKLREDDSVRAVVLHVNSPGGSALASDLIWREVDRLQKEKPVVACFEDVAASGGFYLAAPAAEIIARPATLTGSIGVFGGKLVVGEGLRKLGIHTQEITDSPNANLYSATRPFSDDQRVRFRQSLQRFYDGFVGRVAAGRHLPVDEVEPHCRGRVWSGKAAFKNGLIDRHGDLLDAIERARALAGLEAGQFRRRELSAQPNRSVLTRALQSLVRSVIPGAASTGIGRMLAVIEATLGVAVPPAFELLLTHPEQALAMIDFDLGPRR